MWTSSNKFGSYDWLLQRHRKKNTAWAAQPFGFLQPVSIPALICIAKNTLFSNVLPLTFVFKTAAPTGRKRTCVLNKNQSVCWVLRRCLFRQKALTKHARQSTSSSGRRTHTARFGPSSLTEKSLTHLASHGRSPSGVAPSGSSCGENTYVPGHAGTSPFC